MGGPSPTLQPRAARTRERILDAAVGVLVDDGYAAATTSRIQEEAGVSRGALVHHFPSKAQLLLAATEHLAQRRAQWLARRVDQAPPPQDPVADGVGLLWATMSGPLFAAATELWVASRTDEDLRSALLDHERRLGEGARALFAELMGLTPDAAFRRAFDMTLQVLRGAALTALLRDDARWERQVVAHAVDTFRAHLDTQPLPHPIQETSP